MGHASIYIRQYIHLHSNILLSMEKCCQQRKVPKVWPLMTENVPEVARYRHVQGRMVNVIRFITTGIMQLYLLIYTCTPTYIFTSCNDLQGGLYRKELQHVALGCP